MTDTASPSDNAAWSDCSAGQLQAIGRRLRRADRRRRAAGLSAVAAVASAVAFVLATSATGPLSPGGISCATCVARFDAYGEHLRAAQAAGPDQPTAAIGARLEEVRRHLEGCSGCRQQFAEAYPDLTAAVGVGGAIAASGVALVAGVWKSGGRRRSSWQIAL